VGAVGSSEMLVDIYQTTLHDILLEDNYVVSLSYPCNRPWRPIGL
jgi:hypothetical protein